MGKTRRNLFLPFPNTFCDQLRAYRDRVTGSSPEDGNIGASGPARRGWRGHKLRLLSCLCTVSSQVPAATHLVLVESPRPGAAGTVPEAQQGEMGVFKTQGLSSPRYRVRSSQVTQPSRSDGYNTPTGSPSIWAVLSHGQRRSSVAEGVTPKGSVTSSTPHRTHIIPDGGKDGLLKPQILPTMGCLSKWGCPSPASHPVSCSKVLHRAFYLFSSLFPFSFPSHPWSKALGLVAAPGRALQPHSPSVELQGLYGTSHPSMPPFLL